MPTHVLPVGDSNWRIRFDETDGVIDPRSFRAEMAVEGGGPYHAAFVTETAPNGSQYESLKLFEHDGGKDRIGDVVITFRVDQSKRRTVQVEEEDYFEDEVTKVKSKRSVRSSVQNIAQAVKRTVVATGEIVANPRRIGSKKKIKTHYVLAGPITQMDPSKEQMDVFEFVQTYDALGLAAFVKALQHMPERPARELFNQMRHPAP